ncbi:AzlD domain-containing protein [Lacibacterium aquatile]|uniref:AzlD domain-containing protein n=1 Tax=Lacibacterium aquatile TaxID=1168082 RepID=A0ABW5DW24_9PROT
MTLENDILLALAALAVLTFALRAGGFVAVKRADPGSLFYRLLYLAPGNLFIGFAVAGIIAGGVVTAVGIIAAVLAAQIFKNEMISMAAGAAGVALTALALAG